MISQNGRDNQIERKTVEFKELSVTESLSIVEMSQVFGGNPAVAPPAPALAKDIGGGGWGYGYGAPARLGTVC